MQPILKVNLTDRTISQIFPPDEWTRDYLGGASLAARLLYDEITPEVDPLSSDSVLLFLNGPLSGTAGPATGRTVVCGKSPATGLWAESHIGGFWGTELRKSGYDGIWVTGKSQAPVVLDINDDLIRILDGSGLWGMDTYEVQTRAKEMVGRLSARVAGIGIAGENLVNCACILSDHGRVAGRTGLGAVMGAKKLKAIVVSGSNTIPVKNPEIYKRLRSKVNRELIKSAVSQTARELGTAGVSDYMDYLGSMPKKYFSRGEMPGTEAFSGAKIAERYLTGVKACHACVIACGREIRVKPGDRVQKGPEYETLVGFGPNLWIDDPEFTFRMNQLCDRYGMDTITVSNTIGLAMSLYDEGLLSADETGGLEIEWGKQEAVEELVHLTAIRERFGKEIAKGSKALEEKYGRSGMAIQVNGLELAYHDPRGLSGMALVYVTSPRGACHNQSDYYLVDIGQAEEKLGMVYFDRQAGAEKAANVAIHQNWRAFTNSLIVCIFGNVSITSMVELVNAACGRDLNVVDCLRIGERGWNLKRVINNRLGLRRENDRLPKSLLNTLQDGGAEGYEIDFQPMLRAYYEARDWDWETGFPSTDKLKELGLGFVVKDLLA